MLPFNKDFSFGCNDFISVFRPSFLWPGHFNGARDCVVCAFTHENIVDEISRRCLRLSLILSTIAYIWVSPFVWLVSSVWSIICYFVLDWSAGAFIPTDSPKSVISCQRLGLFSLQARATTLKFSFRQASDIGVHARKSLANLSLKFPGPMKIHFDYLCRWNYSLLSFVERYYAHSKLHMNRRCTPCSFLRRTGWFAWHKWLLWRRKIFLSTRLTEWCSFIARYHIHVHG